MATPEPLDGLDAEQQAVCLGARTTLTPAARERLRRPAPGRLDRDRLWALAHLHEIVPLLAETLPAVAGDALPAAWLARARKRRHVTLSTNARLGRRCSRSCTTWARPVSG